MAIDHHDTDALRDARFTHVDLSGAVFGDCDLSRVKIVDSALVEVSLSGDLANVRVNDVDITGATDAWALRAVLGQDAPYHRIGLPAAGYPPEQARAIGLNPAADPSWAEVLRVRTDRQGRIRELLERIDEEELSRTTRFPPAPGYPTENRTVGRCLRVVINESANTAATPNVTLTNSTPGSRAEVQTGRR